MSPTTAEREQMLRGADLRVTRPRMAVLSAVYENPHADTDAIIAAARESMAEVSHQAVYDVLRALTSAGLIRRLQPPGSLARYEARIGDNHHHVVCRSCGAIADVDCAVGHVPCLTASDDAGFEIDEAEITYWGRCPSCAAAASSTPSGSTPSDSTPSDSTPSDSTPFHSTPSDSTPSHDPAPFADTAPKKGTS